MVLDPYQITLLSNITLDGHITYIGFRPLLNHTTLKPQIGRKACARGIVQKLKFRLMSKAMFC